LLEKNLIITDPTFMFCYRFTDAQMFAKPLHLVSDMFSSGLFVFSPSEFRERPIRYCQTYGVWVCLWLSWALVGIPFHRHRQMNFDRSLDLMLCRSTWRQPRLDGLCEEVCASENLYTLHLYTFTH